MAGGWDKARIRGDCSGSSYCARRWLVVEAEDTPHLARWRSMLDPKELARADRYHFAADRNIYTAAHALARFMLSEAAGLSTRTWRYVVGEFGKPALAAEFSKWNLHFNISHTRGLAACAIASQKVGVDVERSHRSINLGIARHYFAPEEVRILSSAAPGEQANIFFRFWPLKEAFIKATGEGPEPSSRLILLFLRTCPHRVPSRAEQPPR